MSADQRNKEAVRRIAAAAVAAAAADISNICHISADRGYVERLISTLQWWR